MPLIEAVSVPRGPFTLAAHLHRPDDHGRAAPIAAVVLATPGSSVKEQIGATYARALAARGFLAVAFDPAHQGDSGGEPRDLESPAERVADLRHVVDFVIAGGYVDPARIGLLGVCAGGGYAARAAMLDHRVRALGGVVPVNIGRAFREGAAASPGGVTGALDRAARRATAEARGEVVPASSWLPDTAADAEAAGITDVDVLQAVNYYRTSRGGHPGSTNRRHHSSDALLLGFDAFHLADELITQPVQVVVAGAGGSTGSLDDGRRLAALAPAAADVLVVERARHYEMYDEPAYVDRAVDGLAAFFEAHLAGSHVVDEKGV